MAKIPQKRQWPLIGPSKLVPKSKRRELWGKYSKPPVSSKVMEILKLGRVPFAAPREDKIRFLRNNWKTFTRVVSDHMEGVPRDKQAQIVDLLHKNPEMFPEEELNAFVKTVGEKVYAGEFEKFNRGFNEHFKRYLKERGFDFEKRAFSMAIEELAAGRSIHDTMHTTPMAFEKVYVKSLKRVRNLQLILNRGVNKSTKMAFKGKKITPQQKKAVLGWMRINSPLFEQMYTEILFRSTDATHYARLMKEAEELIAKKMNADLAPNFFPAKKTATRPTQKLEYKKLGDRETRMAQYSKEERTKDENRRESFEKSQEYAKKAHKPFNPTEYCLTEISKENQQAGTQFRQLVNSQLLHTTSLRSLFTKGSLTQKNLPSNPTRTQFC